MQSNEEPTSNEALTASRIAHRAPLISPAADAADSTVRMPLVDLLAGHVVQHGETVQMLLKPSRWFVVLNSLAFMGMTVVATLGLYMTNVRPFDSRSTTIQFIILLCAGRLMWSVVQWMGRYYILTNLRVIRVSGVFTVDVQSYPLRRVEAVKLWRTVGERLLSKGTLEITGSEGAPIGWQTISRPNRIMERVQMAVSRAKNTGGGAAG